MPATWQLVPVPVTAAMVAADCTDASLPPGSAALGNPIADLTAPASGLVLQWMDPAAASRWLAYARTQYHYAAAPGDPDARANAMAACANGIAQYFNCCNVPWQIDAPSRALYRRWIVGAPTRTGGQPFAALFDPLYDYSVLFSIDRAFMQGTAFGGYVPAAGRSAFEACMTAGAAPAAEYPGQFLEAFALALAIAPGAVALPAPPHVDAAGTASSVVNAATPASALYRGQMQSQCVTGGGCTPCPDWGAGRAGQTPFEASQFDAAFVPGTPLRFTAPLAAYLPWLDAWLSSLEARTPQRVAAVARIYCAWLNAKTAAFAGGQAAAIQDALRNDAQLASPDPNTAHAITAAASVVTALGAAVVAAAVAGTAAAPASLGISALISGAIIATVAITAAVLPPSTSGLHVDDLYRLKPVFERAWLSGLGPGDASATGQPALTIPDPPTRTYAGAIGRATTIVPYQPPRPPVVPFGGTLPGASAPMSTPVKLGLLALGLGGGAYAAQAAGLVDWGKVFGGGRR